MIAATASLSTWPERDIGATSATTSSASLAQRELMKAEHRKAITRLYFNRYLG
jgi:hypothetical protein